MAARSRLKDIVSIQVVAFPQSGVVTRPGTAELLDRAVQEGAELIGGIDPAGIDRDPAGQLDVVFGIAGRHGAGVDIHLHDPGELGALQIRMIAERTRALGLAGKVSVSHAFCLGMVDEAELGHLVDLLVDNGIAIMTNAPGDRPMPPLARLRAAGVTRVLRIGRRARCLDAVRHGGHARARHAARLSQRLPDRRAAARRPSTR